jgi:hypothetical protein
MDTTARVGSIHIYNQNHATCASWQRVHRVHRVHEI